MKPTALRERGIPMVLAVGAAIATWALWTRPAQNELHAAQQQAASHRRMLAELPAMRSHEELEAGLVHVNALGETINAASTATGGPSEVHSHLGQLAAQCGLSVERIEPRTLPEPRRTGSKGPEVRTLAHSMTLVGSFEGAVRFVRAVESEAALVRITAARIQPGGAANGDACVISLDTLHVSLAAPLSLAGAEGQP